MWTRIQMMSTHERSLSVTIVLWWGMSRTYLRPRNLQLLPLLHTVTHGYIHILLELTLNSGKVTGSKWTRFLRTVWKCFLWLLAYIMQIHVHVKRPNTVLRCLQVACSTSYACPIDVNGETLPLSANSPATFLLKCPVWYRRRRERR